MLYFLILHSWLPLLKNFFFVVFQPLVENGYHAEAMLGVSSLVYSYCTSINNNNCSTEKEILELIESIEKYIGDNCETNSRVYKEAIIVALKSIGNAGILTDSLNDKILKCFKVSFEYNFYFYLI